MTAEQAKILGLFCYKFAELAAETLKAFAEKEPTENQVLSLPSPITQKRFMNRKEVAEFLGVSVRTVSKMIKEDNLPTASLGERRIQFDSEKVSTWANEQRIKGRGKTKLRVVS